MLIKKNIFNLILLILILPYSAMAESQDFMRSTGKIYVVVALIALIFVGIVYYLSRLDKKVKDLEEKI